MYVRGYLQGSENGRVVTIAHIPNIIDLSGKTNKLWSGQASLRRSRRSGSGRKNQTRRQYVSLRSKGRHNNILFGCKYQASV